LRAISRLRESSLVPNIIVDGAANLGTELALSHWPNSTTPQELRADLSAEIVFNYLAILIQSRS